MALSTSVSEAYAAIARNLRFSDVIVLIITTSFITYRIFKRFEPDKLMPVGLPLALVPSFLVPALHLHVHSLPLAVATTFISYYALIIFYVATYRLSPFHPLAQYPGPIVNKLSKFTMSYITSTGKQHIHLRKLHERYGDIVRTGPNELSVNRVDTIQPVLTGMPKGPWWYNRKPPGGPATVIAIADPVEHKRRRRTWDRGFSTVATKNYEEIITRNVRELVEQFEKREGQEVDLSKWLSYFSYDFMGHMAFGTGFDLIRTGHDANGVWATLEAGLISTAILAHVPWLWTYLRLITGAKARTRSYALAIKYVNRRIQGGSKIKDLFYHLTDEEGLEPVKPSMQVVMSDGLLAVIGGSDTTATTFTAIQYYFLLYPSKFDRLRNEIDAYFPHGEEPTDFARMANMPYLNACINEALRLLPPVLSGSQRSAERGCGGKIVGPYFIPEGNQIFNHFYTIQRDPRNFSPYPDLFLPERWLPEQDRHLTFPNECFVLDTTAFNPFSYGPGSCVGKNLALQELREVTCFIVQRFNIKVKEGFRLESWEEGIEDFFVIRKPALPVVVEARR